MGALTGASATSLARLIAGREVTAREAVEAHLRRIEAVDARINAVVQLDAERALRGADAADGAVARGEPSGPLHGVPFTVKDTIAVAGRDRPDELDHAAQPDRLAGGDRARRDLARGACRSTCSWSPGHGATTWRSPRRCGSSASWGSGRRRRSDDSVEDE